MRALIALLVISGSAAAYDWQDQMYRDNMLREQREQTRLQNLQYLEQQQQAEELRRLRWEQEMERGLLETYRIPSYGEY